MSLAAAANAGRLTFEEFQAVSSRAKVSEEQNKGADAAAAASAAGGGGGGGGNDNKRALASSSSFGDFLEMPQVQGFVAAVMVLDTFSAFAQLLIRIDSFGAAARSVATAIDEPGLRFSIMRLVNRLIASSAVLSSALSSFSGFALLFSALEICATLVVFHVAVVGHIGYATDCLVVGIQIWTEYTGDGLQSRLLNLLRFWRIARLVASLVAIEKEAHGLTRKLLSESEGSKNLLQDGARRIEEELEKEKEARRAVDEMLASYKEEVDTLNEALKIAAMDIAEVAEADDDLLSDDDDEDEEEDDGGDGRGRGAGAADDAEGGEGDEADFVDAAASGFDRARNREVLMREARREANNPAAAAQRKAKSGGHTFHVHEDGSFVYK